MPLYEYRCDTCGHTFEALQRLAEPPLADCPQCGGSLRKLWSSPAVQFKGSGWYVTDYARKSGGGAGSDAGGGAEKPGGERPAGEAPAGDKAPAADAPATAPVAKKPGGAADGGAGS